MSKKPIFNPSRLSLARKRRGLTMRKLAVLIGVDPRSVSAYEKGEFPPDIDRLQQTAKLLRFPLAFFYGDDLESLSPDSVSFRALSRMTAGKRDIAL
ncbi:helix-turn-helix domain-containing protein, partial [Nitrospiraceae bacterium AH_259_D15_M11_P09]|nr:helix-turn-helix domain-containing protein [Nitrospiraceae bacterium AH_259_D15_M11_P09]